MVIRGIQRCEVCPVGGGKPEEKPRRDYKCRVMFTRGYDEI